MNKIIKYILKGRREDFSFPVVLSRTVFILMAVCFISIVSYLGFLYAEGKRDYKAIVYLNKRYTLSECIYDSIFLEFNSVIIYYFPDVFADKMDFFHRRTLSIDFGGDTVKTIDLKDLKKLQLLKYLSYVDISSIPIDDILFLKGLPIEYLEMSETKVIDLSPLKGMPLESLDIEDTPVSDLSPLQGMPLEDLHLSKTKVSNLSPLQGMPLVALYFDETPVSDLKPLEGMSLSNIGFSDTQIRDLTPLKNIPLVSLDCGKTPVSDLEPLEGMPLERLNISNTDVTDLSPLEGLPLEFLDISGCKKLKDLRVLLKCRKLVELTISEHFKNIEFLKASPNIQIIIYKGEDGQVEVRVKSETQDGRFIWLKEDPPTSRGL